MAFRSLIIEDELPAAKRLGSLVNQVEPEMEVIEVLDSVAKSVEWLQKNEHPDLIFMDIQLADDLSFSIFNAVDVDSPVIFTTAYDEYALHAFKVNSIDYLLKPVDIKELEASIRKWRQTRVNPLHISSDIGEMLLAQVANNQKSYKSRFLVKMGERLQTVKITEVMRFSSENKVTFLHTSEGKKYFIDDTLEQLSEVLDPQMFFRLNRQAIASVDSISEIHTYFNGKLKVYLHGAEEPVVVSKEKAPTFKVWLNR